MKRSVAIMTLVALVTLTMSGCNLLFSPSKTQDNQPTNQGDSLVAQADIDAGIDLLKQDPPDFTGARTMFLSAVSKDPTYAPALMWSSLLNLAAISVDTNMATMMSTYFGISGYPTNMNTLFTSDSWMMVVDGGYWDGGYYDDWGYWVDEYWVEDSWTLPTITIPGFIKTYHDGEPGVTTMDEWRDSLIYNIATRNSTGFNALADSVTTLLDSGLSGVLSALNSVPTTASIAIPGSLFGEEADIVIGKAELQLEAATLYNLKSSIHMGKSISLSLPLQQYYNAFNPIDNSELYEDGFDMVAFMTKLKTLDTPFESGFLMPRADAATSLAAAKAATLTGLQNMSSALTALSNRTSVQAFTIRPDSFLFDSEYGPDWVTEIKPSLQFASNMASKTYAAISNNSILYVPVGSPESYPEGPMDFISEFAIITNWPTSSDLGTPGNWIDGTDFPTAIALRPSAAYETPLFAISNLLDMDMTTGEPKFYKVNWDMDTGALLSINSTAETSSNVQDDEDVFYALKIKDLTLTTSLVLSSEEYLAIKALFVAALIDMEMDGFFDLDKLMTRASSGAVSLFIPLVPGDIVYDSLKGVSSFWWAIPELAMGMMYMMPMDY